MSECILRFQSQLTGILETMLKGAIYDITKLVEESFLEEVLRSRREIKTLTERLQSSEKKWRGEAQARLKCREYSKAELLSKQILHGGADKQSDVEEWFDVKEGKTKQGSCQWQTLDRAPPCVPTEVTCNPTRVLEIAPETPTHTDRDEFDFVCKEESVRATPCGDQRRRKMCLEGFEAAYAVHIYGSSTGQGFTELSGLSLDAEVSPSEGTADKPRHRRNRGDVCGLDSPKSSETALETVSQKVDNTGNDQGTGRLNDHVIPEAAAEKSSAYTQGNRTTVPEKPGVSKTAEQDEDGRSDQERTSSTVATLGTLIEKTESFFVDAVTIKDEDGVQWNEETGLAAACEQYDQRGEHREELQQVDLSCMSSQEGGSWFQKLCSIKMSSMAVDSSDMQRRVGQTQMMDAEPALQGISDASKEVEAFVCGSGFTATGNAGIPKPVSMEDKSFSCLHCGKSFTLLRNLKDHQRYHTGKKSYTCTQCGKGFVYMCHLKVHLQSHTGERPFSCTLCGKSFTYLCNLKSHQLYHTGEKPFSCGQCGKSFSQLSHLKKHRLIHSGDRPHGCKDCGKSFSTNGELRRHQQTHLR